MTPVQPGQVSQAVAKILKERDELRIETTYQGQIVGQLGRQLDYYESLLISTQCELKAYRPHGLKNKEADDGVWIGTWLSTKKGKFALGPAETAWSKREHQRAIAILDAIILGGGENNDIKIRARLLKAVVGRDCGLKKEALVESEDALQMAIEKQLYDLAGMAQFHRGVCFFHMEKFAEASFCFSLAAHTRNYCDQVSVWKQMAEEMRLLYPSGDLKRRLEPLNLSSSADLTDQPNPVGLPDSKFFETTSSVVFEEIHTPRIGDFSAGSSRPSDKGQKFPPEIVPKSYWKGWRGDVKREDFEEYRGLIMDELERLRLQTLELSVWKREKLKDETEEAIRRHIQIGRLRATSPETEPRGPPKVPIPLDDLYDEEASRPGHFIFTSIHDKLKELNIKALCVRARLAIMSRHTNKALQIAEQGCQLALEFDFEPIYSKAQFWRGAAAYQMGDWNKAVEAFDVGRRAKDIYMEGAVAEAFLERAKAFLAAKEGWLEGYAEQGKIEESAELAVTKAYERKALRVPDESLATTTTEKAETTAPTIAGRVSPSLAAELGELADSDGSDNPEGPKEEGKPMHT
ncbi:hypothetical protein FGG08_000124 [Glutinoglossum americanum]|uniref:Uncharacterized protein n=1 Tax=Glutinoglossum americanum TaxID=1670608 RepID=A0A9P8L408_9PEZI|nr:hypothetical protein FGG08_000124 [Glutinoglossum americanum]